MIPYLLLYVVLLCLLYYSRTHKDNKTFKIAAVVVFLFIGLRAPVVGADTWRYYCHFMGNDMSYLELEFLYELYVKFVRILLLHQGQMFMLLNTFLSLFMVYKYVDKYSTWKTFSVLMFFCIVAYQNYFVALRQILGISIILFGYWHVLNEGKKRWLIYAVCVFCAWGIHTTSLLPSAVLLICYFVRISNRTMGIVIIIASAILGVILKKTNVVEIMYQYAMYDIGATERLNNYFVNAERFVVDNSGISLFRSLLKSLVAIIILLFVSRDRIKHSFISIYVFGVALNNFFADFFLISRVTLAFSLFGIIAISWIWDRNNNVYIKYRMIINSTIFLMVLYYSIAYFNNHINYDPYANDKMHPYYFFFEDYRNHPSLK